MENGERGRRTAVIWIPAEAYYSAITNIFEMQLWKKIKKYQYIAIQVGTRPSSRVSVILGVDNGERGRGTAVIWIPAEAYYSAITNVFEMQLWKN